MIKTVKSGKSMCSVIERFGNRRMQINNIIQQEETIMMSFTDDAKAGMKYLAPKHA